MITKTAYLAYIQCPKNLWLAEYQPELATPPDPSTQRRLRTGQEVDKLAREWFPDGRLIPYRPHPEDMAPLTTQAIHDGANTLFQATFHVADLLVKVDILIRLDDGWHLVEVKSSTGVKEEHLPDAAFQCNVLNLAGIPVKQVSIMHLNRECRYPDLNNLFILADVTNDVKALLPQVAADVAVMQAILAETAVPHVSIGRYCNKPYICRFYDYCWQAVEGLTIYHIPRLNSQKETQLQAAGVLYLTDVPADFPVTSHQRSFIDFIVQQQIHIDTTTIQSELGNLAYPIHFFDFETIDYAIPVYDGCRPYQQVPFQYSCHVLAEDGSLSHCEYLHLDADDPRLALVDALLDHIGKAGSIVVYFARFERERLLELAAGFPEYEPLLIEMTTRLWDQLEIFKKHYRHYGFGDSNSLKSVLPVVVPELSYQTLEVQNGSQAQVVWEEMVHCLDSAEKAALADQLRAYCQLDTLAMVELHRVIANL